MSIAIIMFLVFGAGIFTGWMLASFFILASREDGDIEHLIDRRAE